jgi:NAD(P)-dependent dehydrogenase (short-subunit alcohol dehydrogenase family)
MKTPFSIILHLFLFTKNRLSALAFPTGSIVGNSSLVGVAASKKTDQVAQEIIVGATAITRASTRVATTAEAKSKSMNAYTRKSKTKSNVMRWAIHGVLTELFHNVILRTFRRVRRRRFATDEGGLTVLDNGRRYRQPPKREIAVVTGATGGIGSQIVHDLALRGYDVVIAARDATRGVKLATEIRGLLSVTPLESAGESNGNETSVPTISFFEYHADVPQSALNVASFIKELGSPLSILINNAGIMGKSKQLTMHVNLLGPAYLTFALLPLMTERATRSMPPTVINVGSSAHLRATHVLDEEYLLADGNNDGKRSWIDTLPAVSDNDLSTYAQSKLALMQLSTILRHWLPTSGPQICIIDAHPGLVWTPLLRDHIGDRAVRILTRTGLANLLYKSSFEGAQAIVSALDFLQPASATRDQVYFVNGEPGVCVCVCVCSGLRFQGVGLSHAIPIARSSPR